ncbi:unnamed protein product [Lota lota]
MGHQEAQEKQPNGPWFRARLAGLPGWTGDESPVSCWFTVNGPRHFLSQAAPDRRRWWWGASSTSAPSSVLPARSHVTPGSLQLASMDGRIRVL